MRLPPYPHYKPSGVEWLGDVPEHWEVKRSDTAVTTAKRQISPEAFAGMEVMHYSIPVVQETGTGAVENGEEIASAKQLIVEPVVLVSRLNPRKATICRAAPHRELLTLASTEFVALKPTDGDIRFLAYLVSSELFRQRLDSWVQSVTRSHQRARPEEIYRFWNAWPEPAEQRAIADFLDRETEKIDTLAAKKRTLIERLQEQRTALVSLTVTRGVPPHSAGMDPHPKLKPSGIDWLGDVPEHWKVKRLKFLLPRLQSGVSVNAEQEPTDDDSPGVLKTSCVYGNRFRPEENKRVIDADVDRVACPVTGDSVIVSRMNTPGLVGSCGHVSMDYPNLFLPDRLWIARFATADGMSSKYAWYLLTSHALVDLTGALATGTSGSMKNLSQDEFLGINVVAPLMEEQRAIAEFLDRETERIDGMVGRVVAAIERLQEYRGALITAAVSGEIDVRQAAAK